MTDADRYHRFLNTILLLLLLTYQLMLHPSSADTMFGSELHADIFALFVHSVVIIATVYFVYRVLTNLGWIMDYLDGELHDD